MPIDYCFTKKDSNDNKGYVVCVEKKGSKSKPKPKPKSQAKIKAKPKSKYLPVSSGEMGGLYAMVNGKRKYLQSMRQDEVKKYGYRKERVPGPSGVNYKYLLRKL